jgi:hypothetical protein
MSETIQAEKEKAEELPKTGGRGKHHKDQPRSKNVRLRDETYERLKRYGDWDTDVDDLVTMMLDYWEKGHKKNG